MEILPKKSLGQHFLINPRILDKIVAAAEITKEDTVLEIGPGTGNLTKKLAEKAGRVIAIEKDGRLIEELKKMFRENENVEIIEGDVLKFRPTAYNLRQSTYKIVANIPYYITSRFLRTVFEKWPRPKLVVLTIQKEVAKRIVASPPHSKLSMRASRPKMNLLAVSVQFFSEPTIVGYISKENFRPKPKVDSAVVKLAPREKLPTADIKKFFKIVRAGFSQKRKLLISNLEKLGFDKSELTIVFEKLGINLKSRAENLNLDNWIKLLDELKLG